MTDDLYGLRQRAKFDKLQEYQEFAAGQCLGNLLSGSRPKTPNLKSSYTKYLSKPRALIPYNLNPKPKTKP